MVASSKTKPAKRGRGRPRGSKNKPKVQNSQTKRTRHTGVMKADEVLTIDAFCERFKVTRIHVADMRRKGLIVRAESERNLRILGSDYHEFLKKQPVAELAPIESEELAAANK